MALWMVAGIIIVCFLLIVLRGAPYIPTHRQWAERAVRLVPKKGLLVDLGSGDGTILRAAAQHGYRAVGIELNPLLVLISRWRLWRYRHLVGVKMGDFWLQDLPVETITVFVFLAGPFMRKLDRYLHNQAARLGHDIILVSYAFELPQVPVVRRDGPLVVQRISASEDFTTSSSIK